MKLIAKSSSILLSLCVVLGVACALPALAQTADTAFQDAVKAYQQSRSYEDAEKVIKLAAAMDQPPPIPTEARRYFVRGAALIKDAKSPADYAQCGDEFLQAARLAPWWTESEPLRRSS
jgi:hypothetical protein